jgi:hypothetical protein
VRLCRLCSQPIPAKIRVDGKAHSLQNRKYCLACSPYKAHNTRPLTEPWTGVSRQERSPEAERAKFRRYQRKERRKRKQRLVQMAGGCCLICGYNKDCPAAYAFHHRNPEEKLFDIGRRGILRRWEELLEEVKKCVLLCCRCHAEVHSGLHPEFETLKRTGSSAGRALD